LITFVSIINKAAMKNLIVGSITSVKKEWTKPFVSTLSINKDTFAGTGTKAEKKPDQGPTTKYP